jgi:hypothetical protein
MTLDAIRSDKDLFKILGGLERCYIFRLGETERIKSEPSEA